MDSKGIYAMPYDMELKRWDSDYIGISHGPQLHAGNVHELPNLGLNVNAPLKCDCAKGDGIGMYKPLSPRGVQWPRPPGLH